MEKSEKLELWGFHRVPMIAVCFDILLIVLMYTYFAAVVPTVNGDNIEHAHSSFLVAEGFVPYRDFFQHHNPLLWYLFAPIARIFAYDTTIAEVTCFISFLVFLKSMIYVYRISSEFLTDKIWALMTVMFVSLPGYKLFALDFRPDNYMVFCLMGGIYYYFKYLKEKNGFHLSVAFVWFVTSFLFAQKALFPLFILGLSGLYFWWKKDIKTQDLLKALIVPSLMLGGFGYYLYHYDMVQLYYESNYTFNLKLADSFEVGKIAVYPPYTVVLIIVGLIGSLAALKFHNKYLNVLAVLCLTEYFQRKYYFSPFSYYYWMLIYFAGLCGMTLLYHINKRYLITVWLALGWGIFILVSVLNFQREYVDAVRKSPYLPDYVTRNINKCDYVFNGDGMMYNIFGKDPAYYWQLIGQLDIIGEEVGIREKPNINELILKLKPKIVYGKNYYNKFAFENKKIQIAHYIDMKILSTYYNPTDFEAVYILKKEYDNRDCLLNENTGRWEYKL